MPIQSNIIYGMYSGLALLMDVHTSETSNQRGIIFISGSGWRRPTTYNAPPLKEGGQYDIWGQAMVERGYTVFSINHRAVPRFPYPGPFEDAQRAMRFVRYHGADYGIDPKQIGALGGSSGGHLVSSLGTFPSVGDLNNEDPVERESAKAQCVVARAAPLDLRDQVGHNLFDDGQGTEVSAETKAAASPALHVTAQTAPHLLLHGDADPQVPYEQSPMMQEAIEKAGVDVELIRVPGGGHGPGFGGAGDMPSYIDATGKWFDRYLLGKD